MSHPNSLYFASESPAVDVIALFGRCLGNFSIVEKALAAFRDSGSADLVQLKQALEISDFRAMTEICHRLKGAASNVSSTRLCELLARAERSCRENDRDELSALLEELDLEWGAFEHFAEVFAPTANASMSFAPRQNVAV